MKSVDKVKLIYIIAAAVSVIFFFIKPSISFGLILGFVFCILNIKLVFKVMDEAFAAKKNALKILSGNSLLRFALLAGFIYLAVVFVQWFSLWGITIGMILGMLVSIFERKKVS